MTDVLLRDVVILDDVDIVSSAQIRVMLICSQAPMSALWTVCRESVNWVVPWKKHRHTQNHDDVIKWKHFPRNWPFVRGIHRSPVNSPHKGQWRGALMFTLICARIYGWVNTREAGDLRRYRLHYDVIVMFSPVGFNIFAEPYNESLQAFIL